MISVLLRKEREILIAMRKHSQDILKSREFSLVNRAKTQQAGVSFMMQYCTSAIIGKLREK